MLIAYSPGNSLLHRSAVRTKMLGFLEIIVLAFLFQNPLYQLVIIAFTSFLALRIDISLRKIVGMIAVALPNRIIYTGIVVS